MNDGSLRGLGPSSRYHEDMAESRRIQEQFKQLTASLKSQQEAASVELAEVEAAQVELDELQSDMIGLSMFNRRGGILTVTVNPPGFSATPINVHLTGDNVGSVCIETTLDEFKHILEGISFLLDAQLEQRYDELTKG